MLQISTTGTTDIDPGTISDTHKSIGGTLTYLEIKDLLPNTLARELLTLENGLGQCWEISVCCV